jgi:hypothetical protein
MKQQFDVAESETVCTESSLRFESGASLGGADDSAIPYLVSIEISRIFANPPTLCDETREEAHPSWNDRVLRGLRTLSAIHPLSRNCLAAKTLATATHSTSAIPVRRYRCLSVSEGIGTVIPADVYDGGRKQVLRRSEKQSDR